MGVVKKDNYTIPWSIIAFATLTNLLILGELIKDKIETQGNHTITWNGRNENGKEVSSGVFFYVLEGIHNRNVKKIILMK